MEDSLLEEERYQFKYFDSESAFYIGSKAVELSKQYGLSICIQIYAYGKTLFHYANDNCSKNNEDWLMKKKNSVMYFQHSTKHLNEKNKNDASVLYTKYGLNLDKYCITQGGFPIYVKGCGLVGAICISGMQPNEDHDFLITLLEWYLMGKECKIMF